MVEMDADVDLVKSEVREASKTSPARVSLSIVPHAARRLLEHGPVIVRLQGEGVVLDRKLLFREDAVDPAAEVPRFEITFKRDPTVAHRKLIAHCLFYVCDQARCRPVEMETEWGL